MADKVGKRVLIMFGGRSCEHDISIITGVLALNCTDRQRYIPVPVYVTEDGWFTGNDLFDLDFFKKRTTEGLDRVIPVFGSQTIGILKGSKLRLTEKPYCALNCCHGLNGEDGSLAGVMQLLGVPFASPAMAASSACMDKSITKVLLDGLGIKNLPYKAFNAGAFFRNREMVIGLIERKIGYPCIVKPARLGSSIGIKRAETKEELIAAIEHALRFDGRIIVEKALDGFLEINCAAYRSKGGVRVSECERPVPEGKLLTFDDKYKSRVKHAKNRIFPADVPREISDRIKDITSTVYRKLYMTGIVRIDYLVKDGEVYLNEVNTVPGSLAAYLFCDRTGEFPSLITELIEEGVAARREFDNGTFTVHTDVLTCTGSKHRGSKRSTILN